MGRKGAPQRVSLAAPSKPGLNYADELTMGKPNDGVQSCCGNLT
jgi:hypothetical protein